MRSIPGMLVCCPCDGNEMRLATEALINYEGPAYLRLERLATLSSPMRYPATALSWQGCHP